MNHQSQNGDLNFCDCGFTPGCEPFANFGVNTLKNNRTPNQNLDSDGPPCPMCRVATVPLALKSVRLLFVRLFQISIALQAIFIESQKSARFFVADAVLADGILYAGA
jgi:hypothetical protein